MRFFPPVALAAAIVGLAGASTGSPQEPVDQVRLEYRAAVAKLQPHLVDEQWLDDDPRAVLYLEALWAVSQRCVASWLNAHPTAQAQDVVAAVTALDVNARPQCLKLADHVFLVTGASPIANVFIVAKSSGQYEVAWKIEQNQNTNGLKEPDVIGAWRAESAKHGGRGPYFTSSGSVGSLETADLGILASDSNNRPRFYIDAVYAQSAGATVGEQTSVWRWNGTTAEPLIAHSYAVSLDASIGVRVEGQDLKIREKQQFRTFSSSGASEARRVDRVVRVTPDAVGDGGEISLEPELDLLDKLFDRVIHHRSAEKIASHAAVTGARRIVRAAQSGSTAENWAKVPTLGMIDSPDSLLRPRVVAGGDESICLDLDRVGGVSATFEPSNHSFYVTDVQFAKCSR